jgi:hypothetical protein
MIPGLVIIAVDLGGAEAVQVIAGWGLVVVA